MTIYLIHLSHDSIYTQYLLHCMTHNVKNYQQLTTYIMRSSTKLCINHSWVSGIQVCSNAGPYPFPRGDNFKIAKIHWQILKIFFSRTTVPISTKLSINHPWVKGILDYSNKWPLLFPRGDDYEIMKIHWQNFKIFFSRTTGPISTKLSKNILV